MVIWFTTRCAMFWSDDGHLNRCSKDGVCRYDGAPFCREHGDLIAARVLAGEEHWGTEQPLAAKEKE